MPLLDGKAGVVFLWILGSLFVIIYIISAIKAIRDRSLIKKRRAQKKRERLSNGYINGENKAMRENESSNIDTQMQPSVSGSVTLNTNHSGWRSSMEHLDLSIYSIETGVDNLTFNHSTNDIKYVDDTRRASYQIPKTSNATVPLSERAYLHSSGNIRQEKNLNHLPTDCLAIQKSVRRHSYEIAICENSWLPMEPPSFAMSQTILNTYNYGGSARNIVKSSKPPKVSTENRTYDKHGYMKR